MSWKEKHEARRIRKFINNGLYAFEDLTRNEFRIVLRYYPYLGKYIQTFFERRQELIEQGEWTKEHEPPDNDRRIKRYERGEALVKPPEEYKDDSNTTRTR